MRKVNGQLSFPFTVILLFVVACACSLTNREQQPSNIKDPNTRASPNPAATKESRADKSQPGTVPPVSLPTRADTRTDTTPSFLLQGWIQHISSNVERTYDFTQAQAAGRRTVEIRAWQKIGSLGWQSNQPYTADYTANENEIALSSPAGGSEQWRIVERGASYMVVQDKTGHAVTWFNCEASEWPKLIRASTRGCR